MNVCVRGKVGALHHVGHAATRAALPFVWCADSLATADFILDCDAYVLREYGANAGVDILCARTTLGYCRAAALHAVYASRLA
jgi:hypothetical protein